MSSSPAIILNVVDFPHPEGPTRTTNSLSFTVMLMSFAALTLPSYTLPMPFNNTVAILASEIYLMLTEYYEICRLSIINSGLGL